MKTIDAEGIIAGDESPRKIKLPVKGVFTPPIVVHPIPQPTPPPSAPLSLEAIFQPFNEFFRTKFGESAGASMSFRFARIPHAFVDSDFIVPAHPEWGPSQSLAQELLSGVVDGIPVLDPDGRTVDVGFGQRAISELYHDEILGPAVPFTTPGAPDGANKQALIDAFNQVKADAVSRWEMTKLSPVSGVGDFYRPSDPDPVTWWNKDDVGAWVPHSFPITGADHPLPGGPAPADPRFQILRMRLDDGQMRSLLAPPPAAAGLQAAAVPMSPALSLRPATRAMLQPALASTLANAAVQPHAAAAEASLVAAPVGTGMHADLMRQISVLPFAQRTEIQSKLAYFAPTQPVASTGVTISFDFCVVSLKRRWLHSGFLDNVAWCIPGQPIGHLSANDGRGVPTLPVGFVAIKKLRITAPWTPQDIANLERSMQFGPFNFDSKVVDGAIAHDGIQIVGWMLEALPSLPPN